MGKVFESRRDILTASVAALLNIVLGFVWSTALSRKPFLDESSIKQINEQLNNSQNLIATIIFQNIGNIVMAIVLMWLIKLDGKFSAKRGAVIGFLMWMGFILTTMAPQFAFQGSSWQHFAISASYPLIGLVMMGAIIGGWKRN